MLVQPISASSVVGSASVVAAELKPLRLNFAQVCIYCGQRWCESAKCVARHEESRWAVCSQCDGTMLDEQDETCGCAYGLEEVGPLADSAATSVERPAARPDGKYVSVNGFTGLKR